VGAQLSADEPQPERIEAAYELIRPHIRRTPVIEVDAADFGLPASVLSLKLELLQHGGSFKARGAFTHCGSLPSPEERPPSPPC
jgi:threonine dehydratase